jgi:hypothetical protein
VVNCQWEGLHHFREPLSIVRMPGEEQYAGWSHIYVL